MSDIRETVRRASGRQVTEGLDSMEAVWNGAVIARSDRTVMVEGNHYFPPETVRREFFEPSEHQTYCPWKGTASYYDVVVGGERNAQAAWYYPSPMDAAEPIRDHVAFWHGVEVRAAGG